MKTNDFKHDNVRSIFIERLKRDLIGPSEESEIISENPISSYITGILSPIDKEISEEDKEELGNDIIELLDTNNVDEEEDDKISKKGFKKQSSMGVTFYVDDDENEFIIQAKWGKYKALENDETKVVNDDIQEQDSEETEKKSAKKLYQRIQREEKIKIDISKLKSTDKIEIDGGIYISIIYHSIPHNNKKMVSVYLSNENIKSKDEVKDTMFQAELYIEGSEDKDIFCTSADSIEQHFSEDDYYYIEKPVFAKGHGCAAMWEYDNIRRAKSIFTTFIPEHEICSVSTVLEGFDEKLLSMKYLKSAKNKIESIKRLRTLLEGYKVWISNLEKHEFMENESYQNIGKIIIQKCKEASERIENGISLIESNKDVFHSFCFMNQVMFLQNAIKEFSNDKNKTDETTIKNYTCKEGLNWRPFQIAFILLNIEGIVNVKSNDRKIVDLLFFPTGGGKTEAYLGLAAFVIGYRRITRNELSEYEKDGGVTIFLRYTLRLLTTQQRDRLLKMVVASEIVRQKNQSIFGNSEISIGFWVGGNVSPNKFDEFVESKTNSAYNVSQARKKLTKQIIKCPYCGSEIKDENYKVDTVAQSVEITCSNRKCYFNDKKLPIYIVDEEIFRKCPTVIISTVDKFARLPWDEKVSLLFGKRDRYCERHGNIALGEDYCKSHRKTENHPAAKVINELKPFYPPELIIQDELHLITGPLGSIYGGYETAIEELCCIEIDGEKILPKYIVSTATIKNAKDQVRCLYGRNDYFQFPPQGHVSSDSYFAREVSLDKKPFRKYVGICASGQSMKTTLLRTYAVLLQTAKDLELNDDIKDYLDPYHTLIGYFNSTRELGGTVRLLQDDIPKRIKRIIKKYNSQHWRTFLKYEEITSRTPSWKIPQVLEQLEKYKYEEGCLDVAIATNMIAVGMDVNRLGLMAVTGQPKQSAEYIQASSRVGRSNPGLVVTIYNPYRPRDLSHYENFTGYHSQLYRHVEGTTATPFAARARDRVLHAVIISLLRHTNKDMALNKDASNINNIDSEEIASIKNMILQRVSSVEPFNLEDTEYEFDMFIDLWKELSEDEKKLFYYVPYTDKNNRLMNYYDRYVSDNEKATLNSMREVESASQLYYYQEGDEL